MRSEAFPARVIRCPACGGDALYAAGNPWRPFCSARCRAGDFGAWASETFAIAAKSESDPLEADSNDPSQS